MLEFCLAQRMRILKAMKAGTSKTTQHRNSICCTIKGLCSQLEYQKVFKLKKMPFLVELNLGQGSHGMAGATFGWNWMSFEVCPSPDCCVVPWFMVLEEETLSLMWQ